MNRKKTKMITQGAMLSALFGVLGMINLMTGTAFDIFLSYLMTAAIVYYVGLYDYKAGLAVVISTTVILFIIGQLFFMVFSALTMLLGVYYGYCRNEHLSSKIQNWGLFLISLAKNIIIYVLLAGLFGIDIVRETLEVMAWLPGLPKHLVPEIIAGTFLVFIAWSESYIVRFYSQIVIRKLKKIN